MQREIFTYLKDCYLQRFPSCIEEQICFLKIWILKIWYNFKKLFSSFEDNPGWVDYVGMLKIVSKWRLKMKKLWYIFANCSPLRSGIDFMVVIKF